MADPRLEHRPARPSPSRSSASAAGSATRTRGRPPTPRSRSWTTATRSSSSRSAASKTGAFHGAKVGNIAHLEAGTIVDGKFYPKGKTEAVPLSQGRQGRRPARARQGPLRQLHRRRAEPQGRGPQRRHPRGPLLRRALPPGQHLVPARARTSRSASRPGPSATTRRPYETLARMEEHLKENKVALDGLNYRLGRKLTFDAATRVVRRRLASERAPDPALPGALRRARPHRLIRGLAEADIRRLPGRVRSGERCISRYYDPLTPATAFARTPRR